MNEHTLRLIFNALAGDAAITSLVPADRIVRSFSPVERAADRDWLVFRVNPVRGIAGTHGRGPRWCHVLVTPCTRSDITAIRISDAVLALLDGVTLTPLNGATPFFCEFDNWRPGVEFDTGLNLYTDPCRFRLGVHLG